MTDVRELHPNRRLLTPAEVAELFRRDEQWVYENCLPARTRETEKGEIVVTRKAGCLFAAARRLNRRTLLFERDAVERIISGENGT